MQPAAHPWCKSRVPPHPEGALVDWDLGTVQAISVHWTHCILQGIISQMIWTLWHGTLFCWLQDILWLLGDGHCQQQYPDTHVDLCVVLCIASKLLFISLPNYLTYSSCGQAKATHDLCCGQSGSSWWRLGWPCRWSLAHEMPSLRSTQVSCCEARSDFPSFCFGILSASHHIPAKN